MPRPWPLNTRRRAIARLRERTPPMKARTILSAAIAFIITVSAFGQNKLSVGDAAPGLDIEKWVKGNETTLATGNVYVVEFWATWCVPCKKSIPHLSELQREFS